MIDSYQKPPACADCALNEKCTGFAAPFGNPLALYRFCGEAAGGDEASEGSPFVGVSGHMLFDAIKLAGIPSVSCTRCTDAWESRFNCTWCRGTGRDFSASIYIYNLVQCRPPGNDFSVVESEYNEIENCQSRHVAPAPDGAITFLIGAKSLEYHFPTYSSIELWSGSLLLNKTLQRFIPVFHPAYILRVPALTMTLPNAIAEGVKRHPPFLPVPGRVNESGKTLFVDVETAGTLDGPIVLIGACTQVPFVEHFDPENPTDRTRFQELLDNSDRVVAHNAIFDLFKIQDAGFRVDPDKWFCSMLLWHFYQPDLPKSLDSMAKYVLAARVCYWKGLGRADASAWKIHCEVQYERRCGADNGFDNAEKFYNAIDVITLAQSWCDIVADVQREGRWSYFVDDVMPCGRVFWQIERGGMRVDLAALAEWRRVLDERVVAATTTLLDNPLVQAAIERRQQISNVDLASVQSKHDKWIAQANDARYRAEIKLARLKEFASTLSRSNVEYKAARAEIKAFKLPKLVRSSPFSKELSKMQKACLSASTLKLTGPQKLWLIYEGLRLPKQYAERKLKYGRKRKTLSANKDCLNRILGLWTVAEDKKSVVRLMIEVQHWSHWLSTFAAIEPGSNGYIYPRIQIRTATGRAASGEDEDEKGGDSPTNAQNWPKEMRNVILPDVGHVLIQADYDQQEWMVQLWEAGDLEDFARTIAGEDRHSKGACALYPGRTMDFYLPENRAINPIAENERSQAKRLNYGLAYGMGSAKLALTFGIGAGKKRWEALAEAEAIITKLKSAYPLVTKWQDEVVLPFVKKHKYLQTKFGWRRYSYRFDPSMAKAMVPSATGAGMMHTRMPVLHYMVQRYGARLLTSTHDSFAVSCPPEVATQIAAEMKRILEAPFQEMDGFWCPVTVKTGANWKEVA